VVGLRHRSMHLVATLALALLLTPISAAAYDWPQFNGGPQHTGNITQETTITPDNVRTMRRAWTTSFS